VVDTLAYLASYYWPYMLGALIIGLGAGWFSYAAKK